MESRVTYFKHGDKRLFPDIFQFYFSGNNTSRSRSKNPGVFWHLVSVSDWIKLDWIKGACGVLVEVYVLLSVILVTATLSSTRHDCLNLNGLLQLRIYHNVLHIVVAVYSVKGELVSGFVLSCSSHWPAPSVFVRETPSLESLVHHSRGRWGNFKHIAEAKVQHIPTDIIMIPERLLRKDHDRTGVDWQGQPVVQIHVLQPVVVHLNENTGIVKQFLFSTQVITLRVGTCVQWRKKPLQCITARWNGEWGESRRGSGSLIDFTELDELWTERSARHGGRDWGDEERTEAQINFYRQGIQLC